MSDIICSWCDHKINTPSSIFSDQCSNCDLTTLKDEIDYYGISDDFSEFLKSKIILTDCDFWELSRRILNILNVSEINEALNLLRENERKSSNPLPYKYNYIKL